MSTRTPIPNAHRADRDCFQPNRHLPILLQELPNLLNAFSETTAAVRYVLRDVRDGARGQTMFCTQCGAEVEADDRFCWTCGTKLREHLQPVITPPARDSGPVVTHTENQKHNCAPATDEHIEPEPGEKRDKRTDPDAVRRRRLIADAIRQNNSIGPSLVTRTPDSDTEEIAFSIIYGETILTYEPKTRNPPQDPDERYSWCDPCFYQRSFSLIQRNLERLGFAFAPEAEVCADGRATIVAHTAELSLPGEEKNSEEHPRIAITLRVPHDLANRASIPLGDLPGEAHPSTTEISYFNNPQNDIVSSLNVILESAHLDNVTTVTATDGVVLKRALQRLNGLGFPRGITKHADSPSFTSYEHRNATVTVKGSSAACPHYEVQAKGHADRIAITLLFSEERKQVKKPSHQ